MATSPTTPDAHKTDQNSMEEIRERIDDMNARIGADTAYLNALADQVEEQKRLFETGEETGSDHE